MSQTLEAVNRILSADFKTVSEPVWNTWRKVADASACSSFCCLERFVPDVPCCTCNRVYLERGTCLRLCVRLHVGKRAMSVVEWLGSSSVVLGGEVGDGSQCG